MRLNQKLGLLLKIFMVELGIIALIGVVFYFQFDNAKKEFVTRTRAIAETIGGQATNFYQNRGEASTSDEFYLFLDERLGREKLFNTFGVSPKFFSVTFTKQQENEMASGHFLENAYPPEGYSVEKYAGKISVSVPFLAPQVEGPLGIVKIDSDTKTLMKKVFSDNFLLYVAILVVLNNQAFILQLFFRRRKEEIAFGDGYLKEHSIGALKLMHKVLGDIIEDHASEDKKSAEKKTADTANVISISNAGAKLEK
ncbi:MAG: hypothetical protein OXF23_00690 [Candidatus Dadabacteria bacterium]|nr:hypothetical protein [Candidatus Dadabacteria bacterium]MCY4262649.1 hypothetical protein [Candidatus Dadabacteria bacterium]